ncbi:hypothetical protein RhiirB3_407416 [Rhizophagus irregularis]|nr:hypothetical protein RhiirB3_407416 [Rhizophagus irregularis]
MEMVIMNGSADHAQDAKKALNDTIEELRGAAENANIGFLKEMLKELEGIMMITNGSSGGNHLSIPLPLVIQMLEQNNNNNLQNTQKPSSITSVNNGSNDNNTTSNTSTTSKYSDDNFGNTIKNSTSGDGLGIISDTETNSPTTVANTINKNSNTPHLQQQSNVQLPRSQLQNQQIHQQFMMASTFSASPTSSPGAVVTSLHQQFNHLSSFDASNQNDNNHHQISPQSGNQWEPFYMDDILFDNVNPTNSGVSASHNQVMEELSSIYPGFNNYSDSNDGSVGPR